MPVQESALIHCVLREQWQELFQTHNIFATLVPSNKAAIREFDRLVNAIHAEPTNFARTRCFVVLHNEERCPMPYVLSRSQCNSYGHKEQQLDRKEQELRLDDEALIDRSFSSDGTVPNTPEPAERVWDGCYTFSFEHTVTYPKYGWAAGYRRSSLKLLPDQKTYSPVSWPDVVLAFGNHAKSLDLHGASVHFNFAPDSGAFGIRAIYSDNSIRCDTVRLNSDDGWRVLLAPQVLITIGQLDYVYRWVAPDSPLVRDAIRNRMRDTIGPSHLPHELSLTAPTPQDRWIGDWKFIKRAGMGTEGEVTSAISRRNELVAVKEYKRSNRQDADRLQSKITNIRDLCTQVCDTFGGNYVQCVQFVVYGSNSEEFKDPDRVYICLSPLVQIDLAAVLRMSNTAGFAERADQLRIVAQILAGVGSMHNVGFLHDDLKPANIGIKALKPPEISILDLDSCKFIPPERNRAAYFSPRYGSGGTIGYLAPEREGPRKQLYGQPVDIWAIGCIGMQLLANARLQVKALFNPYRLYETFQDDHRPPQDAIDNELKHQQASISSLIASPRIEFNLLARMLDVDPIARVTVAEALQDPALVEYVPEPPISSSRKRKKQVFRDL